MKIKFTFLFLIAGLWISSRAQENLQFRKITTLDGLSSNSINYVTQDKYGYLWIIAGNELNRFDGKNFQVYRNDPEDSASIGKSNWWELYLDQAGDLWVNGQEGLAKYNYAEDNFTNYPLSVVFNIIQDHLGKYWLIKLEGSFSFDPETGHTEPARLWIDSIMVPSTKFGAVGEVENRLYLHQNRLGLFEYDRNEDLFREVEWENSQVLEEEEFIYYMTGDSLGNIWLNGRNLYKYDRKLNRVDKFDLGADDRQWISMLDKDEKGNLWIQGEFEKKRKFLRLNPYTNDITVIDNRNGLDDYAYYNFFVDVSGVYWIAGSSKGLFKADPSVAPVESLRARVSPEFQISTDSIRYIHPSPFDPDILWIGTYDYGLYQFSESTKTVRKINLEFTRPTEAQSWNMVNGIFEDEKYLWFGLSWVGLCRYDKSTGTTKVYYSNIMDSETVLPLNINKIISDPDGNLWLAGNRGLTYFNVRDEKATNYYPHQSRIYSSTLMELLLDIREKNPENRGISQAGNNETYTEKFTLAESKRYVVQCVGEVWFWGTNSFNDWGWISNAAGDTVWTMKDYITTRRFGDQFNIKLDVLTLAPGTYTIHYISDSKNSANELEEELPGRGDWYGLQLYEASFDLYDAFKSKLSEERAKSLLSDFVLFDIHLDHDALWIATGNGVDKLSLLTGEITYFFDSPINQYNSETYTYFRFMEQNDSVLWVASDQEGLVRFNKRDGTKVSYSMKDGLPSDRIFSIVEDDLGNLWLGTDNGVSKFINKDDPTPPRFVNYDTRDGLNSNSFNRGCAARTGSGRLYFGSFDGLNALQPTDVNSAMPIIGITRFTVRNRVLKPGAPGSPLAKSILETSEIVLAYDQNSFGFEFAAFHFSRPGKNKLAYKLEGFDQDWIYDNSGKASYTNMDPGTYVFRVKGSNGDGYWNEEGKSIRITILKPWWNTWWAYILYMLLFAALVYAIDRIQRRRLLEKERHHARERELQQAREIEKAYTKLKMTQNQLVHAEKMASLGELTAGIAHEIQNPLNFVNNFSEVNLELIGEAEQEFEEGNHNEGKSILNDIRENEKKIGAHGRRADAIVKGMLQHSRTNSGQKEPTALNELADEYLRLAYHGLRAKDKSFIADFRLEADKTLPKINVVAQDIGRVLLNLINNAFYAVDERSKTSSSLDDQENYKPLVTVRTKKLDGKIEISVSDNGNGIPDSVKDKIFQPFFTTKPTGQGTGLGLSMSYDIITKGHGGELSVESKESEGAEFIIQLPV